MYNGIGLTSARGSGTNGYVQRNLSFVRVAKEQVEYKPDEELKKLEAYINKKGNAELLKHDRKRKIEMKCMEMQDLMEEQGFSPEDIEAKVQMYRKVLMAKEEENGECAKLEYDEFGRPIARESHQAAEANDFKNKKLREAFGIGEFDRAKILKEKEEEQRAKLEQAAQMRAKKHQWVDVDEIDDDSKPHVNPARREREAEARPPPRREEKDEDIDRAVERKKKKKHHSESHESSEDSDRERRKKRKESDRRRDDDERGKDRRDDSSSKGARDKERRKREVDEEEQRVEKKRSSKQDSKTKGSRSNSKDREQRSRGADKRDTRRSRSRDRQQRGRNERHIPRSPSTSPDRLPKEKKPVERYRRSERAESDRVKRKAIPVLRSRSRSSSSSSSSSASSRSSSSSSASSASTSSSSSSASSAASSKKNNKKHSDNRRRK